MERFKIPGLKDGKRHPDWKLVYQDASEEKLPWYFPKLDPDIASALLAHKGNGKTLLDVGTGLGNQAYLESQLGFQVTGVDLSPSAIEKAGAKYPNVRFLVDDICETKVKESFDVIIDKGCFHVLETVDQSRYIASIQKLLKPRGLYLLKIFNSEMGSADFGPLRFSGKQIVTIFGEKFEILKLMRTVYHGSVAVPPLAWFVVMRGARL